MPTDISQFPPVAHLFGSCLQDMPDFTVVPDDAVPAPYHELLVHDGDMTSRLGNFHQSPIALEVLKLEKTDDSLFREVLLQKTSDQQYVEYGIIQINLQAFKFPLLDEILAGEKPLGGLLNQHEINYTSCPQAFFSVKANAKIAERLQVDQAETLYGRINILSSGKDSLAHILEILPPSES